MDVWLVIPAWRRPAVTRLCLAQKQHLAAAAAARGITCRIVVVADDENLEIAEEHGFDTVNQTNTLGRKVNDGFEYACARGADYVAFVGSDDWLHEDTLDGLVEQPKGRPRIVAGHRIAVVDLEQGRLRRLGVRGPTGVSPWFIPRWALARCGFRPAHDDRASGMEGSIHQNLGPDPDWVFHDPHDLVRVDFKTDLNMTPYDRVSRLLGYGDEVEPWGLLAERYPMDLVGLAYETHKQIALEAVA
jgi:glycosyltransferase involved in cell wall biosynthesis